MSALIQTEKVGSLKSGHSSEKKKVETELEDKKKITKRSSNEVPNREI